MGSHLASLMPQALALTSTLALGVWLFGWRVSLNLLHREGSETWIVFAAWQGSGAPASRPWRVWWSPTPPLRRAGLRLSVPAGSPAS